MDMLDAIRQRHSVRTYLDAPLTDEDIDALVESIGRANYKGNLSIQLRVEEPSTFVGGMASYGSIKGAKNYLALVGPKGKTIDERLGYYGEQIVLDAQARGLNTCWLGLSYNKSKMRAVVAKGEVCPAIVVVGYGADAGKPHKVKELERLCLVAGKPVASASDLPLWFRSGLEAAQFAPTAVNQQRFRFDLVSGLTGNAVHPSTAFGPYTKLDLGIAKRHFEIGANAHSTDWMWV